MQGDTDQFETVVSQAHELAQQIADHPSTLRQRFPKGAQIVLEGNVSALIDLLDRHPNESVSLAKVVKNNLAMLLEYLNFKQPNRQHILLAS